MRGTRRQAPVPVQRVGIIPADAGNTICSISSREFCEDHPRGCGEHRWLLAAQLTPMGSSPRMRGTRYRSYPRYPWTGIIPADAGNTIASHLIGRSPEDHPRGCGEHIYEIASEVKSQGSSPRMRGTLP